MTIKSKYYIEKITVKQAMEMVIANHYLHRKAACTHAFGLFEISTHRMVGTITYGEPASPNVCRGICGEEERKNVYELTRLWIEDNTPKNVESFLIGNTLRKLDREIIISFAEFGVGHVGTVYQATNFLYCGLTEKRTNRIKIDGTTTKHNRHECMKKEDTVLVERPRKHRYIYFNANSKRKKYLFQKLRYEVKPYPKAVSV